MHDMEMTTMQATKAFEEQQVWMHVSRCDLQLLWEAREQDLDRYA